MGRMLFKLLAGAFLLLGIWVMWGDITDDNAASVMLGQYLYERTPSTLQIAEAVIDRYIDPCSLIVALGCSPFLWHPLISGLLQCQPRSYSGHRCFVLADLAPVSRP